MFEFCQAEKRWQVHYRLVCSTFCSQKAFQKSVWKEIRQYFKYLKRIKAFQNALSCMTNNKNRMWIMSTKLETASFASIVNYLDVARMHLYHVDKEPVIVIPLIRLHTIFMIASHWQLIGRQFSVFPSTLFILCWRRLIASSYRLKTISSPQNPLIPSPSGDGQWLVFYVFFMIEIFSLRGGLPRMQSMTLKYLSSG